MNLLIAPIQGFTDAAWRSAHARAMARHGLSLTYFAPFIRVEKGSVRPRDMRDIDSANNPGVNIVPQVIFKDITELQIATDAIIALGYQHINLNMGCPFPPQLKAGRGTAVIKNLPLMLEVAKFIDKHADLSFSIKMRPGLIDFDLWREIMPTLNSMRLEMVIVHPRRAADRYNGEISIDSFRSISRDCTHPVVYNGDITTPLNYAQTIRQLPDIQNIMIGRGVLARPSLPLEIVTGKEWTADDRRAMWVEIFKNLADTIVSNTMGGSHQALDRLKPRLEYVEANIFDRRYLKSLKKASTLERFLTLL